MYSLNDMTVKQKAVVDEYIKKGYVVDSYSVRAVVVANDDTMSMKEISPMGKVKDKS